MSSSFLNSEQPRGADSGELETPRSAEREAPPESRGKLKIFLGYAAGVGKTYQMLEEAQELKRHCRDVVVGYFEPHARPDTIEKAKGLETIPRRTMMYRGVPFEEMDTEAILQRKPDVAVVDEFPHTNVPGAEREKRWQDVMTLLNAGIDVLTTMNVQHLESFNDQVHLLTGVRVRETVPDWVVQRASEVIMVDLTPRALLNRLDRGVVYNLEKAELAKKNFFKESTLVALRELALRQTAYEVEHRHAGPENIEQSETQQEFEAPKPRSLEKVLVHITSHPSTAVLIRRGKRVADYMHGECVAVVVCPESTLEGLTARERETLEKHIHFARNLHVPVHLIAGPDVAEALVKFARENGVTQMYLSRPKERGFMLPFRRDLAREVTRLAKDLEVTIVAERRAQRD
jgi:two-component system, OmpR family, sensor histidine kinase KdpD